MGNWLPLWPPKGMKMELNLGIVMSACQFAAMNLRPFLSARKRRTEEMAENKDHKVEVSDQERCQRADEPRYAKVDHGF